LPVYQQKRFQQLAQGLVKQGKKAQKRAKKACFWGYNFMFSTEARFLLNRRAPQG